MENKAEELPISFAFGCDARIQHPEVGDAAGAPLRGWAAPSLLESCRLRGYRAVQIKRERELGIKICLVALQRWRECLDMQLMSFQIKAQQA